MTQPECRMGFSMNWYDNADNPSASSTHADLPTKPSGPHWASASTRMGQCHR